MKLNIKIMVKKSGGFEFEYLKNNCKDNDKGKVNVHFHIM